MNYVVNSLPFIETRCLQGNGHMDKLREEALISVSVVCLSFSVYADLCASLCLRCQSVLVSSSFCLSGSLLFVCHVCLCFLPCCLYLSICCLSLSQSVSDIFMSLSFHQSLMSVCLSQSLLFFYLCSLLVSVWLC